MLSRSYKGIILDWQLQFMCQNQNKLQNWIIGTTGEKIMARAIMAFKSNYSLSVKTVVRDHHVYKEIWNLYKGEKLMCNYEKWEETKIFEDHAVGTYKDSPYLVMFSWSHLFCFLNLLRKGITKYLQKSIEEENCKMAWLYLVFIMLWK